MAVDPAVGKGGKNCFTFESDSTNCNTLVTQVKLRYAAFDACSTKTQMQNIGIFDTDKGVPT